MEIKSVIKRNLHIEWRLLVFLIMLINVKLAVKGMALVYVYIVQPDFKFGLKFKGSRLPLFYALIAAIGLVNFFVRAEYTQNYLLVVLFGLSIWAACLLIVHQIKLFIEKTELTVLHNTILVFFLLNMVFSILNLMAIWTEIGIRNPFLYQGEYQKYFLNSGDFIKGISFDVSTTNAVINSFGVIYFLYRRYFGLMLASMVIFLLTCSNYCSIVLMMILAAVFFLQSNREQKSIIAICFFLLVIFMVKVSPQNYNYVISVINKYVLHTPEDLTIHKSPIPLRKIPDSLLTDEGRKEKIAILYLDSIEKSRLIEMGVVDYNTINLSPIRHEIPGDSIHTPFFQWKTDTNQFQKKLIDFIHFKNIQPSSSITPAIAGKIQGFEQSFSFLRNHHKKIITGDGIGNFSSMTAFRATGLKIAGAFPSQLVYNNADFLKNHFSLYAFFFTRRNESHSIVNSPASVFDQLLMEYGILGLIFFLVFYLGYFIKDIKYVTYGIPLLFYLLSVFWIDYWFERLSIVIIFELLFMVNIKEQKQYVTGKSN